MVQWDCIDSIKQFCTQEKRIVITEFTYTVSVAVIASVRGIWDNYGSREGHRLEFGVWRLEFGAWSLELGAWSLELGAWSLELGVWSLELGAWSLEFGWSLPCYGGGAVGGVHGPDRA